MIAEYDERIAVRLSSKHRQQIEELIRNRKFKNISEVIRKALIDFFENWSKGVI